MRVVNTEIEILHNMEEKNLMFEDNEVLNMQINNFNVKSSDRIFNMLVNKTIERQKYEFLKNVHIKLYPSAVKDFKKSQINNFFFAPYQAFLSYTITQNQDCVLSYFYDNYTFTGGAHGTTIREGQTFSYKKRRQLELWNFFRNKQKARELILNEIISQANTNVENNPGIYFDNYEMLIRKNFNPENFYLTPQGITIFYNQYEIAPYSTGIVEFTIPYAMVDLPPTC